MSVLLIEMFSQGLVLAYPFSLLPALNHPKTPIRANLHSSSWLGSIIGLAYINGFMMSSVLTKFCGRRFANAIVILSSIVGWLMIYFAKDITTLMIGRFLSGLTVGATVPLETIVIKEYMAPKYKGAFLYLKNTALCTGVTIMHIISRCLDWRTIALVALAPLLMDLLIVYTWPESSACRASKQFETNDHTINSNRGNTKFSRYPLGHCRPSTSKFKLTCMDGVMAFCRQFKQKDFIKRLVIMILSTLVLVMSGKHVFFSYALQIMADITGEITQSFYYSLGIDIAITASALFAAVLGKIINPRTLFFSTGFSALSVLMSLCMYLFFTSKGMIATNKSWISANLLEVYFMLANFGCASISLTLFGEIFHLNNKGVSPALCQVWISICLTVCLKSTPHLLVNLGVHGVFVVYGSIMGMSLLILYFILPETNNERLANTIIDDDKATNNKIITKENSNII
ncbi:unnamed protein product [Arctia plantaginis]|uniref:Major facilitator superfamily (MFS) profile domain-containing protein n=1 Tax=Arctia plantaginis TaxID=874455 RepID=A0A8S1AZ71_ARCPL|nr:unnamed protein product [Arctia plantaginis]